MSERQTSDRAGPGASSAPRRILEALRVRLAESGLQLGVWLAAVIAVSVLLAGRTERYTYVGIARPFEYRIASGTSGMVSDVLVELYDDVEAGQAVASLDARLIETRLARERAELTELEAEVELARRNLDLVTGRDALEWRSDLRRFQVDAAGRQLEALALRAEIESAEIERQRLSLRAERTRVLHEEGIVSVDEYDDTRLEHDALARRIAENRQLLARTEAERAAADARAVEFSGRGSEGPVDQALAPLLARVEAQQMRVSEIAVERERLILRSPVPGRIMQLLATRGTALRSGEPVAVVARPLATDVIGYLPELAGRSVRPNDRV
ncbi:MAG: hypothetical protein E4H03_00120, partial [Myxococcales bacterium]